MAENDKNKNINLNLNGNPVPASAVEANKYPKIKSILATLDKFLAKKFVFVLGICTLAIAVSSGALMLNNGPTSNASGTTAGTRGSADLSLNTWLYSIIVTFAFIAFLATVYFLSRRRSIKSSSSRRSH